MQKVPMTVKGSEDLREELHRLKQIERPKIVKAIAEARAHGDLKENAEYHAAREQQGFVEARIQNIESKLSLAQIIDVTKVPNQGRVVFGATIILYSVKDEKEITYQIVGEDEANIALGKISVNSPLARVVIGKIKGDEVVVSTQNGGQCYEIIDVCYA